MVHSSPFSLHNPNLRVFSAKGPPSAYEAPVTEYSELDPPFSNYLPPPAGRPPAKAGFSARSGRRAPVGGPPQRFESILDVLLARLEAEGADPDAIDPLRHVIFVGQVTGGALTAPITSRELSLKYGGVKTMW